jgi:putative sterol carrier protein
MKTKQSTILFITSFIPIPVFKIVARLGDATLGQAKVAVVLGLVLAGIQITLSRHFLKQTNYLERAFLGFLAVGTVWVYMPEPISSIFVQNSTALLYFVLFLTTVVPQILGYDPFTYNIAKQITPEAVWKTPQFRTINLHLTYFWSSIFFLAFLSCWLGQGKPLYAIVVPLLIIFGIGLPAVKIYPKFYINRGFKPQPFDPSLFPLTAKELVMRMPQGFNRGAATGLDAEIQFDLSGEGGGRLVLSISEGKCTAQEGEAASPTLTIHAPADVWLRMAQGEINRPKALMDGLFTVEGDLTLLLRMGDLFQPPEKQSELSQPR